MNIDDFVAGTGSGNRICKPSAAAGDERMSLGWEHKTPIILLIDAYYMTKPVSSLLNGSNRKPAIAKRSSYGNCGLAHDGSCSSIEAII